MSDTTVNYGFQIPEADGTDYIAPDAIRIPVVAIDSRIKTEIDAIDARLDALEMVGTEDITAIVGAGAIGYSVESAKARRIGKIAMIEILIKRTGADINPSNLVNVAMTAALPAGDWRPVMPAGLVNGPYGGGINAYIETNMQIILTAVAIQWPTDLIQSFHGTYFTV